MPVKLNIKAGEKVLILSDTSVESEIYQAALMACNESRAESVVMIIPPLIWGNEPPSFTKSVLFDVDVLINTCSTSFGHTDIMRNIRASGVRTISLAGQTTDTILKGAGRANWDEVKKNTEFIANAIDKGSQVHVTSANGTNVTFSIDNRSALRLNGFEPAQGDSIGFPSGEAACAPVEGSMCGTIVIDVSMHRVGRCYDPVYLHVKEGKVVRIEGESEASTLRNILETEGDENSYNVAEFALGSNPKARISGNTQEDKIKLGTVHFALGDNKTLKGNISSKIHIDGVLKNAQVDIDGKTILKNYMLCL